MGTPKKTLVLAAFAVVVAVIVVPGAVTADGTSLTDDIPVIGTVVKVATGRSTAPRPQAQPAPTTTSANTVADVTAPATTPAATDYEPVPEPQAPSDGLVQEIDILYAPNQKPLAPQPTTRSAGPCPKATTCRSFQHRASKYPTDKTGKATIKWRFNDDGRRNLRAPAGMLESAVKTGMWQWSKYNSNLVFQYAGLTTTKFGAKGKDGTCADGVNTVTWARFDPSIIAAASTCTDATGRIVRDTDLAMNVTQHWENISGKPDTRHSFDILSIVTHELGHWLSLLDLYGAQDRGQTMSGTSEYGEVRKRTLGLGDVVGLQTVYKCGAGDVCPRTGLRDD